MEVIEFMRDMRTQFGHFEFIATSHTGVQARSENWPMNPRHPCNRLDSEYIKPAIDLEGIKIRKEAAR